MIAFLLSAVLLAAPIPKKANDNSIALLILGKKPELLLIEPSGKEIKRIDLSSIPRPQSVKIIPGTNQAVVLSSGTPVQGIQANSVYIPESAFLITLDGSEKPKELVNSKTILNCLPNRDGTKFFISAVDDEKMANNKKPQNTLFSCWIKDLKSGKNEPVPIPSEYCFVDITDDNSTMLLRGTIKGAPAFVTANTSNWKLNSIKNDQGYPYCFSRNGKLAILYLFSINNAKDETHNCIHDIQSGERQKLTLPGEDKGCIYDFTFDNEGKRIIFSQHSVVSKKFPVKENDKVYICNLDGSELKKIYESKGETIVIANRH